MEIRNSNILITGHTGFKGTWLTLLLEKMQSHVFGFSLPHRNVYVSDEFYRAVKPSIDREYFGDVSNYSEVYSVIKQTEPEIIVHMASHSSLYRSMDIPHHIFTTNMMGVLNVLEAARNAQCVKAIIIVTSDKVYKDLNVNVAYKEESEMGADDPYSMSKIIQEMISSSFCKTFGENESFPIVATVRACNCVGPGDNNESRLLPYLINCCLKGEKPTIRHPNAIRAWQSVVDVNKGYLNLVEYLYSNCDNLPHNEVLSYNFGPGEDGYRTVGELANIVSGVFGIDGYIVDNVGDRIKREANILKLDSSKAFNELGWRPQTRFSNIVKDTALFYKKKNEGYSEYELARRVLDNKV